MPREPARAGAPSPAGREAVESHEAGWIADGLRCHAERRGRRVDRPVVVVGGGIAGASLAYALAKAGVDVLVLEASLAFEDRVRGESMQPWGVAEARELGVEDVLLAAGAHVSPVWKQYVEGGAEPRDIPMSIMAPGVGGSLNLRHPDACQAVLDAAGAAGAKVQRGVRDVKLSPGPPVTVADHVDDD